MHMRYVEKDCTLYIKHYCISFCLELYQTQNLLFFSFQILRDDEQRENYNYMLDNPGILRYSELLPRK